MKQVFSFLLMLFIGYQVLRCQALNEAENADTLIEKYLSNTSNAAQKIKELTARASEEKRKGNKIEAIRSFQVALTLAPYAGDSFETLAKLNSEFASLLSNSKATEQAIHY